MKRTRARFMVVADVHGRHRDEGAVEAALYFKRVFRPTIRYEAGDLIDLACLRGGATAAERRESLSDDLDAGIDFLDRYEPTAKLDGNHEDRIPRAMRDPDEKSAYAATRLNDAIDAACARHNCRRYPYDTIRGVAQIGKLNVVHGFGKGGATMAREHAISFGPVICGHRHTIEPYKVPSMRGDRTCHIIGCLCNTHMEWDKARIGTLTQQHGFAYGFVDLITGDYELYQAERRGDRWNFPTEFTEIRTRLG